MIMAKKNPQKHRKMQWSIRRTRNRRKTGRHPFGNDSAVSNFPYENGIFIHIPKTNGKLEAYNLNDSRLKIKLKSMFKDEVGEFPPDAVIQNCLQYTESHAMELPLEEVKYRIASRDKSVIYDLQNGKCVVVNEKAGES